MANAKRKCKYCKEYILAVDGIKINAGFFCNLDHAVKFGKESAETKRQKEIKQKHITRKKAFRLSDVNHQHKLTQAAFNRLRVLQEKKWFSDRCLEPTCISCGRANMDWCCGHFKTRGSQGNLRYDTMNTFLQCNRYCNMALSGNINGNKTTRGYIKGLKDRFGGEKANEIIDYCESHSEHKKWTGDELQLMRVEFNRQIRALSE